MFEKKTEKLQISEGELNRQEEEFTTESDIKIEVPWNTERHLR